MGRIHGVEDILLGFEPKDAGSIPAGSVLLKQDCLPELTQMSDDTIKKISKLQVIRIEKRYVSHDEKVKFHSFSSHGAAFSDQTS